MYREIINQYLLDIQKEIEYLKKDKTRRYKVFSGVKISEDDQQYEYRFECDRELNLTEGFPVHVYYKGAEYKGVVQSIQQFSIWITVSNNLGETVSDIQISCDTWALLESLYQRLNEKKEKEASPLLKELIEIGPRLSCLDHKNIAKKDQLETYLYDRKMSFIWGPPGTGKTTTLAKAALHFGRCGERVLVLAHSNVAVDQAVLKMLEMKGNDDHFSILRYGYIKEDTLKHGKGVSLQECVLGQFHSLQTRRNQINDEKNKKQLDITTIIESERALERDIYRCIPETLKQTKIIATTASKLVIDDLFLAENQAFDVVIFDEASMAYIPQIFYACSLASQQFLCFGDFRQLAPISLCEEAIGLKQDIYRFLNIIDENGHLHGHPWLVMLDQQYRIRHDMMHFINARFYDQLIVSGPSHQNNEIADNAPFRGEALILCDLSDLYCPVKKTSEHSRINILSALVAFYLAVEAERSGLSVGIITPYAAQARLLNRLMMDFRSNGRKCQITCSTVHQFQGSERDVIIFDTVESFPSKRPGKLTSSNENGALERLVNVAVSRARGKIIVLANIAFWNSAHLSNHALKDLLLFMEKKGKKIQGQTLISYLKQKDRGLIKGYPYLEEAYHTFNQDLLHAKNSVEMMIPNGKIDLSLWQDSLAVLQAKAQQHQLELWIKAAPELDWPQSNIVKDKSAIYPLTIIDKSIAWYDFPLVEQKRYSASNSTVITRQMPIRVKGSYTAPFLDTLTDLRKILFLDQMVDYRLVDKILHSGLNQYLLDHYTCPVCGKPLRLAYKNGYYCRCSVANHITFLTESMVQSYLDEKRVRCPVCGYPLKARLGSKGIYLQCTSQNRHVWDLMDVA